MAKKRRDDTSLASLLGNRRKIDVEAIEEATQIVHKEAKKTPVVDKPKLPKAPQKEKASEAKPKAKPVAKKTQKADDTDTQVVRASIATPYELYLKAKRIQRKEGYRSLGAFYLHCVESYLQKPHAKAEKVEHDFSDSIDVSVAPELELWMQIKLSQRKLGFRNMAGFYIYCLNLYLQKQG